MAAHRRCIDIAKCGCWIPTQTAMQGCSLAHLHLRRIGTGARGWQKGRWLLPRASVDHLKLYHEHVGMALLRDMGKVLLQTACSRSADN